MITFLYDNEVREGVFEVSNLKSIECNLNLLKDGLFDSLMTELEKSDGATLSVRIGIYACIATISIDHTLNRMYFISSNINEDNFYETLQAIRGNSDVRMELIRNWQSAKEYKTTTPICLKKNDWPL
jgi:hypothetical protein